MLNVELKETRVGYDIDIYLNSELVFEGADTYYNWYKDYHQFAMEIRDVLDLSLIEFDTLLQTLTEKFG